MSARFVCPHCHSSLNPLAMERACSDLAEYRICPDCDEPVFFAVLDTPAIPPWLRRGPAESRDDGPAPSLVGR